MKFSLPNWMLLNKKQLLENNRFKDSPLLNSLSTDNQLIIKEPEKKMPSTVGFRRKLDLLPNTLHLKMNSNLTLNSKFQLFTSYLKEKINIQLLSNLSLQVTMIFLSHTVTINHIKIISILPKNSVWPFSETLMKVINSYQMKQL